MVWYDGDVMVSGLVTTLWCMYFYVTRFLDLQKSSYFSFEGRKVSCMAGRRVHNAIFRKGKVEAHIFTLFVLFFLNFTLIQWTSTTAGRDWFDRFSFLLTCETISHFFLLSVLHSTAMNCPVPVKSRKFLFSNDDDHQNYFSFSYKILYDVTSTSSCLS